MYSVTASLCLLSSQLPTTFLRNAGSRKQYGGEDLG